ncbi:MAG: GNAT family N-acetyltransferase [Oscillospiraceae bacterium]|nr:GNAT family N-acetyltransferase [Oscillospiraceae bacterium]
MITYFEKIPSAQEFSDLTESVGWGRDDRAIVETALKNTLFAVCAYDGERIVGFGRLIGDGAMFLYVQDVMVVPEYQSRKIGTEIMNRIMKAVADYKAVNPGLRAYLGASKGKEKFYEKFGFVTRSSAGLGEGMVFM